MAEKMQAPPAVMTLRARGTAEALARFAARLQNVRVELFEKPQDGSDRAGEEPPSMAGDRSGS
jgi:hypothetical protein